MRQDESLVDDRHRIESRGLDRIGEDFACAVISVRTSSTPPQLLVYVTSSEAVEPAKRFVADLKSASRTSVRTTSPRFRRRTMLRIRESVVDSLPRERTSVGIGLESPIDRGECPRVYIEMLPRGQAGTAMERWASESVRRFGRDRVIVSRRSSSSVMEFG
jgi:hypothetical protein